MVGQVCTGTELYKTSRLSAGDGKHRRFSVKVTTCRKDEQRCECINCYWAYPVIQKLMVHARAEMVKLKR